MKTFTNRIWHIVIAVAVFCLSVEIASASTHGTTIPASAVTASTSTDGEHPALYAIDGDTTTAWQLASGQTTGRLELTLNTETLIAGVTISGTIPSTATLRFEFLSNNIWVPFASTSLSGMNLVDRFVDLSYDNAVSDHIAVVVSENGVDGAALSEITVQGSSRDALVRKIQPIALATSDNTSYFSPAENLIDGNTWTSWTATSTDVGFGDMADAQNVLKNRSKTPRTNSSSYNAASVEFDLGQSYTLTAVHVFLPEVSAGAVTISARHNDQWTQIGYLPQGSAPGWQVIPTYGTTGDKTKIEISGFWGQFEKIGEIEFWGTGAYGGSTYALVGYPGTLSANNPIDCQFSNTDTGDKTLEVVASGTLSNPLGINLNGLTSTMSDIRYGTGVTIYRCSVSSDSFWSGDNFLQLEPIAGKSVEIISARLRNADADGSQAVIGDGLSDGFLYTTNTIAGTKIYTFGRHIYTRTIEVYDAIPGTYSLQTRNGKDWVALIPAQTDNDKTTYQLGSEIDSLRVVTNGTGVGEIRVWGSPTWDQAPTVRFIWPTTDESDSANALGLNRHVILGFVDNPYANVTVNGVETEQMGQYFWINASSIGSMSDQPTTITATATDSKKRTAQATMLYESSLVNVLALDQKNEVLYSALKTYTISGSVSSWGLTVDVNGSQAPVSGSRFSTSVALKDGLNIVRVTARSRITGIVWQSVIRKVVYYSGTLKVNLQSPQDGTYCSMPTVTVRGTGNGIGLATVSVNGVTADIQGSAFLSKSVVLNEGSNTITIVAKDHVGRQVTLTPTVYLDTTKPTVTFVKPTANALLNTRNVVISGTVTDASPVWIYVNGAAAKHANGMYTVTIPCADGVDTATVRAVDAAGNWSDSQSVQYIVDTTPPDSASITANPASWTRNTRPVVTFSGHDVTSGIDHYEIRVGSGSFSTETSPYQVPALTDGVWPITVRAIDKAGWTRDATTTVSIDTTPPPAPKVLQVIPGDGRVILRWVAPSADTVRYQIVRVPDFPSSPVTVTGTEYVDTGTINGTTYTYSVLAIDHVENVGPVSTQSALCGLASTTYDPANGSVVQFDTVNLVVPPQALPGSVSKITITEDTDTRLRDISNTTIVGPIMVFSGVNVQDGVETTLEDVHFSREILAQITYDPTLIPAGASEDTLGVYYYDTMWSRWFKVQNTAIDVANKQIYFTTDHFTEYSIQPTPAVDLSPQDLRDSPFSPLSESVKHAGVSVSPQGGGASTSMTELSFPGPNGFDFTLRRIYDTGTARRDARLFNYMTTSGVTVTLDNYTALMTRLQTNNWSSTDNKTSKKIRDVVAKSGDYAYSMGRGWRLDLPYIMADNGEYLLRSPSGGVYSINSAMAYTTNERTDDGRMLRFEMHEGEDLTLYSLQHGNRVTDRFCGITTGRHMEWSVRGWNLVSKDGTSYSFDESGRLTLITDPSGKFTITVAYDPTNKTITSMTDARGRQLKFGYNTTGFGVPYITSISIANGGNTYPNVITYIQDATGKLTSASDLGNRTFSYLYCLDYYIQAGGVKTTVTAPTLVSTFSVTATDAANKLGSSNITLSGNVETEFVSLLSQISGPGIGTAVITYAPQALATTSDGSSVLNNFPVGSGSTVNLSYSLPASKTTLQAGTGTDTKATTYGYTFGFQGKGQFIVTNSWADDTKARRNYVYTAVHKERTRVIGNFEDDDPDGNGGTKSDEYVPLLNTETLTATGATGNLIETTRRTYDEAATLRLLSESVTRSGTFSRSTSYAYDTWGNPTDVTESRIVGRQTTTLVTQSGYIGGGGTIAHNPELWTFGEVAPNGINNTDNHSLPYNRAQRSTAPDGTVSDRYQAYTYDAQGRLASEAHYDGKLWRTTTYAFDDAWGEINGITRPDGHVSTITYTPAPNVVPNVVRVTRTELNVPDPNGVPGASVTTEVGYSLVSGNKLWERDGNGYVTTYTYDALGRVTSTEKPQDGDAPAWNPDPSNIDGVSLRSGHPTTKALYDDSAMTVTVTDPVSATSVYSFDTLGRLNRIEKLIRSYDEKTGDAKDDIAKRLVTTATYDAWDHVTSITNPRGYKTNYEYDLTGRLVTIAYPDAGEYKNITRTMSYEYASGMLTTTDERSKVTTEQLDWNNRVVNRTRTDKSARIVESYVYDAFGSEISRTHQSDGRTDTTVTDYDGLGNVKSVTGPAMSYYEKDVPFTGNAQTSYTYDDAGRLATENRQAKEGLLTTTYTNDGLGRVIRIDQGYHDYRSVSAVAATASTFRTYDANGNKVSETDPDRLKTSFAYSARNKLTMKTSPSGAVTRYAYDADDHLFTMTDPRGSSTDDTAFSVGYRYDDAGRLVLGMLPTHNGARPTVGFLYDERGNLDTRTEPDGGTTQYKYDARDHMTSETVTVLKHGGTPKDYVTTYRNDEAGNQTYIIDALKNETTKTYDDLNRLSSVTSPNLTEIYTYDGYGNRTSVTDGLGHTTTATYDAYGRPHTVTDAKGGTVQTFYDRVGRITKTIDANNNETKNTYDELGRLITETRADGRVETHAYRPSGLADWTVDGRKTTIAYHYDDDGRADGITRTNGSLIEQSDYHYDASGVLSSADDNGVSTAYNLGIGGYVPDAYGRVNSLTRTIDGKSLSLSYSYDDLGRTTGITYPDMLVPYAYDTSGRLDTVAGYVSGTIGYDATGHLTSITAANGVSSTIQRDGDERVSTLTYSGHEATAAFSLKYDGAGNVVNKNESSYGYDELDRLTMASEVGRFATDSRTAGKSVGTVLEDYSGEESMSFDSDTADVSFDYASMSVGVDLGGSREISRVLVNPKTSGHRVTGRQLELLTSDTAISGSWTKQTDYTVSVENDGTIAINPRRPITAAYLKVHCFFEDLGPDGTAKDLATVRNAKSEILAVFYYESYRYETYGHDAKGNRTRVDTSFAGSQRNSTYAYYPKTDLVKSDGKYGYAYDGNGNLVAKGTKWSDSGSGITFFDNEGEYWGYEYDLSNRMTRVVKGSAGKSSTVEVARYRYGPDGLRISKTAAATTTYYVYGVDGNLLSEVGANKTVDTVWVAGAKFATVTMAGSTTTKRYLETDHLGSVVSVTDEAGKLVWQDSQTAFGIDGGGTGTEEYASSFTGKDLDEDVGLYYFNARWYDPNLGRFTSEDPAKDRDNWYAYCGNNPLGRTDPTGLRTGDSSDDVTVTPSGTISVGTGKDEWPTSGSGHSSNNNTPSIQPKPKVSVPWYKSILDNAVDIVMDVYEKASDFGKKAVKSGSASKELGNVTLSNGFVNVDRDATIEAAESLVTTGADQISDGTKMLVAGEIALVTGQIVSLGKIGVALANGDMCEASKASWSYNIGVPGAAMSAAIGGALAGPIGAIVTGAAGAIYFGDKGNSFGGAYYDITR
jgi:RHS repeat-associated protein